jgi:hypothetical protein
MAKSKQKQAYDLLWETRDNLLKFLSEEIIEKASVLTGKTGYEGALGFEYQELDNKYMGRLASLNTFLHNLTPPMAHPRKPPVSNRVEVVTATPGDLPGAINGALKKHSSMRLVSTAVREGEGEEGEMVVLLAFTSP